MSFLSFQDKRMLWRLFPLMVIPFIGILLMVSVGEFQLDNTVYPEETWLWLTVAFLWGIIFQRIRGGL